MRKGYIRSVDQTVGEFLEGTVVDSFRTGKSPNYNRTTVNNELLIGVA